MDENTNLILIISLATNFSALIGGIIAIVRSAKFLPKEGKKADLENRSKEISIADQYDDIATKATARATEWQTRLEKLETDYGVLKDQYSTLSLKVMQQDETIRQQRLTIEEQDKRIALQNVKINEQDELISTLRLDLDSAQEHNLRLISQLQERDITPSEKPKLKRRTSKTNDQLEIPSQTNTE